MDRETEQRLRKIKLLILDVDGVLTDGGLYYSESGEIMKKFHVRDGLGIKLLQRAGVEIAFVTGLQSKLVEDRAHDLGIAEVIQDCMEKEPAVEKLLQRLDLSWEEAAYIGDDMIDVAVMRKVGFAVAVADAAEGARRAAHYVTALPGGKGAVREVADLILEA